MDYELEHGWTKIEIRTSRVDGRALPCRSDHSMCYYERDQCFYVFGGRRGGARYNETFVISKSGETRVLQTTGDIPSPRCEHLAFLVDDYMYMAGGDRAERLEARRMYRLHIPSLAWSFVTDLGYSVKGQACEYIKHRDSLFFVGTYPSTERNVTPAILEFQLRNGSTSVPKTRGNPPGPRYAHGTALVGKNLYLYGGYLASRRSSEDDNLHILDTVNLVWSQVAINTNVAPMLRRKSSSFFALGHCLYMFGGMQNMSYVPDDMMYDTKNNQWHRLTYPSGEARFPLRYQHGTCVVDGKVYIQGGVNSNWSTSQEMYEIDLGDDSGFMSFRDAIVNGDSCPWGRAKLMVVGQGRVGKTSTINALSNREFNPNERSTVGTDSGRQISIDDWHDAKVSKSEALKHAIRAAVVRSRQVVDQAEEDVQLMEMGKFAWVDDEDIQEQQENAEFDDLDEEEDDVDLEVPELGDVPGKFEDTADLEGENEQLLEEFDQDMFEAEMERSEAEITFNIYDYGGQPVFHALHNLFLTEFGVYLLCFRMNDMSKPAVDELEYWFRTVRLHAPKSPILLVGTFGDQVSKSAYRSIDQKLEKSLQLSKKSPFLVSNRSQKLWFFPLDNTNAKGVDAIRVAVKNAVKDEAYVLQRVPLAWMKTIDLYSQHDILRVDTATELALSSGVKRNEFEPMLAFFHELGAIWHFSENKKLQRLVITNPQWLIDSVTCVIFDDIHRNGKDVPEELRNDYNHFRLTAVLSKALVNNLWRNYENEIPFLLELMQSLMLLCPWGEGRDEWLLPCQLPPYQNHFKLYEGGEVKIWKSRLGKIPSDAIFQRLLCLCIRFAEKRGGDPDMEVSGTQGFFAFAPSQKFGISYIDDGIRLEMDRTASDILSKTTIRIVQSMLRRIDEQAFRNKLKLAF